MGHYQWARPVLGDRETAGDKSMHNSVCVKAKSNKEKFIT